MAFSKVYESAAAAVSDVRDGATLLIGGTASDDAPAELLAAVLAGGVRGLTGICDFARWDGADGLIELIRAGRVARLVSSNPFPGDDGGDVRRLWESGDLEIELVPQGTLAERLRAGGAGIGGVFVPVGIGTRFAQGKETKVINGTECVLESPLRADVALLRAAAADTMGNLTYRGVQRGWNHTMAASARLTIVQADRVEEAGNIDPELVITPGIFVNRVVQSVMIDGMGG